MEMDELFEFLLDGLEENAGLEVKIQKVNSIQPADKYKLLHKFLSHEELSEQIRLNCLPIFLDERTKFFDFVQVTDSQSTVKSILDIIPRYCPNIKTVDFRGLWIKTENIENFKLFLKQTPQLKSLRVQCYGWEFTNICGMYQLLFEDDFNLHDCDVKSGLLKIDYINGMDFCPLECAQLLDTLPNLKSLGIEQRICPILFYYIERDHVMNKLYKFTEFYDKGTSLYYFRALIELCPNAKMICLRDPGVHVIKNLSEFPLLSGISLIFENDNQSRELIQLLETIGNQIKFLEILTLNTSLLDPKIIHEFCPKLNTFKINHQNLILNSTG